MSAQRRAQGKTKTECGVRFSRKIIMLKLSKQQCI